MFNHYTVGYHDSNHEHHDICTYAKDSFKNYNGLLNTLHLLNDDLYLKAVNEAKMYGIIS